MLCLSLTILDKELHFLNGTFGTLMQWMRFRDSPFPSRGRQTQTNDNVTITWRRAIGVGVHGDVHSVLLISVSPS